MPRDVAAAQTSDNQTSAIAIAELVTFVMAGVAFIAWFHRAYSNLLGLGATSMRYGTGWAIGAWFVPILNLWRPKQITNDIWRGSDPANHGQQASWREPVSPWLWYWWGAFLLLGILDRVVTQDWNNATQTPTAHAIRSATRLDIATEATSIIAAVLAIIVIRRLTRREKERARADTAAVADLHIGSRPL